MSGFTVKVIVFVMKILAHPTCVASVCVFSSSQVCELNLQSMERLKSQESLAKAVAKKTARLKVGVSLCLCVCV